MALKGNRGNEIIELFLNSEHYPPIPYRYLGINEYIPERTFQKQDEYYLLCNCDLQKQLADLIDGKFHTFPYFHSSAFEGIKVLGSRDVTVSKNGIIKFYRGTVVRLSTAFQYDLSEDPEKTILLDMLTMDFITGIICSNRELAEKNIREKHVAIMQTLTKASIEAATTQLVPVFIQQLQNTFGIENIGRYQQDTPKDFSVTPENRYFGDSTLANFNYYLEFIDGFEIKPQYFSL